MNDNRLKSLNGIISKSSLLNILKDLQDNQKISSCSSNFRCGYPNGYEDQFFAPFYIEFINGKAWVIFSTNSIRTDRISIQQWNAENIKRIKQNVEKAYVIVPDSVLENEKERREVEKYNQKIMSGEYYSAIDYIFYQKEFEKIVQNEK